MRVEDQLVAKLYFRVALASLRSYLALLENFNYEKPVIESQTHIIIL